MKVTAARRAALDVLRAVGAGEFADRAFERAVGRVPARDVGWTHELVYGTLRLRGRLDLLLESRVKGGTAKLDPGVLDVLRLALYQILEMRSVPSYAAVSQAVEQVKGFRRGGAAGLVNAVLQRMVREGDAVAAPGTTDVVEELSGWGSHPRWLVERWIAQFGADDARALVELNNQRPSVFLRPIRTSPAAALALLAEAGIAAEPVDIGDDSIRLTDGSDVGHALHIVPAVVQDPAAALVTRYADVPADAVVADVCAAPGGKTMALAERARFVVGADVSFERLRRVAESRRRLGLGVGLVVADARRPPLRHVDVVLIDAPCTGSGTLRRHPDGKWRLRPADVLSLATLQREILEAAAELVQPGGLLVYATCSLEPEENEAQVNGFLEAHPDFAIEPPVAEIAPELLDSTGCLRVLPHRSGIDGAFAARLRRAPSC